MRIVLIATYELGRQPFGLASPAAMLRTAGHTVETVDASLDRVPLAAVTEADLVAFHLPMHTATRLAAPMIGRVRVANPRAVLCCYGLYAAINEDYLRGLGATAILGGEFEPGLLRLAGSEPGAGVRRTVFQVPDRSTLPVLNRYAGLMMHGGRAVTAGYTEATRGCKHLCRHCPVVPVYQGRFRAVPVDVVLADIRQQVESGGAGHITFGDPDFFNGPTHAVRIVEALHREWPAVGYDVTIKVEHLLRHREHLATLARTGCVFVTTAVESLDDGVLALLEKGHTRADFLEAVRLSRAVGLALSPTFLPFTPWTTRESYRDLLETLAALGLVDNVAPIQLALRLLVTNGSRLLELDDIRRAVTGWDPVALTHRWRHEDPEMDALAARLIQCVDREQKAGRTRAEVFAAVAAEAGVDVALPVLASRATVPYLTEPWYC